MRCRRGYGSKFLSILQYWDYSPYLLRCQKWMSHSLFSLCIKLQAEFLEPARVLTIDFGNPNHHLIALSVLTWPTPLGSDEKFSDLLTTCSGGEVFRALISGHFVPKSLRTSPWNKVRYRWRGESMNSIRGAMNFHVAIFDHRRKVAFCHRNVVYLNFRLGYGYLGIKLEIFSIRSCVNWKSCDSPSHWETRWLESKKLLRTSQ